MSYNFSRNSTYARDNNGLSVDQIARVAPSVLATEAHESRGTRYAYIPSMDVIRGLQGEGFLAVEARQTRCRDEGKREHTKHMVRMRHPSALGAQVGDSFPEVILVNSHDGTSSYQLMSGVYRLVCSNGMVVAQGTGEEVKVRHSGNVINEVIEGSFRVLDGMRLVTEHIKEFGSIQVTEPEKALLAETAAEIRWGRDEETGNLLAPIYEPTQLIRPRRWDDRKSDLWTVFNTIQENVVKGGVQGMSASGRRNRTREISGVDQNVKVNRALWAMAERFAELKLAA